MRILTGIVTSDKMQKTRVVAVTRSVKHPRYHKYITRTSTFKAHDETNQYRTGDTVVIREIRPRSKDKRWTIIARIQNANQSESTRMSANGSGDVVSVE
ncbi:MAG: 30S ribosomal protein S17 [bacterium]|nr:30S ribosomal protein S17 [bacterium]